MSIAMGRSLTRRRLLWALSGLGAVTAAGAGVVAWRGGGSNGSGAGPEPRQGSNATGQPTSLLAFLQPSSNSFERVQFAISDAIDWSQGVFYMDTKNGTMTAYRRSSGQGAVSPVGPRFIEGHDDGDGVSLLLDRRSGREWRWDSSKWRLLAASDSHAVFGERADDADKTGRDTGRYVIAGTGMDSAVEFSTGLATWTRWQLHGNVGAITNQEWRDRVDFVDLTTGESRTVFRADAERNGKRPWGVNVAAGDGDESVVAFVAYYEGDPDARRGPNGVPEYLRQRISWSGELLESSFGEAWFESRSPDGKYWVRETSLHSKRAVGEGSGEDWAAAELHEAAGRVLRVRSAALTYGDNLPQDRWLADGSRFVAMVREPGESATPALPFRYALVSPAGELELLPVAPLEPTQWFTRPTTNGPVPAPDDPNLLSFGRMHLYKRKTGEWFIPKFKQADGPAHWDGNGSPWLAGSAEMVFALGHGGHGGSVAPALIRPLVERGDQGSPAALMFVVERTGSCLNLREKPGMGAAVGGCLPDGTVVQLDPKGELLWEGATQGYSYSTTNDGTWALVRAPNGLRGWVSAAYLGWAEAS